MVEWFLFALLIIVIVLVVIYSSRFEKTKRMTKPKSHYLNSNSTLADHTGLLNPSDLGYDEMRENRRRRNKAFDKILKFVDAPSNSKVILTSGATEGIATCMNWAKCYNPYGDVIGTTFDHESIKDNAEVRDMKYIQIEKPEDITGNCSCIFLTHVNSKTGEILNDSLLEISKKIHSSQFVSGDFNLSEFEKSKVVTSYPPLIFADVSQSITKIPVSMKEMGANGLFFSLHKIGGLQGTGILVISEPEFSKFVPLIAGAQNGGLRGGTQNETSLIESDHCFELCPYSPSSRENIWNEIVDIFENDGLNVIHPKGDHLYNTILIKTTLDCPLGIISELSRKGIYVGTASACENERDKRSGPAYIRISFIDPTDIDIEDIKTISNLIASTK